MAKKLVLLDTSILIDYYRKTDKNNAAWLLLIHQGYDFAVSVITKYEIYSGTSPKQQSFWDIVFENIVVSLDFQDEQDRGGSMLRNIQPTIAIIPDFPFPNDHIPALPAGFYLLVRSAHTVRSKFSRVIFS